MGTGEAPSAPAVEIEAAPAYELLLGLHSLAHQDDPVIYEGGRPWFERVRAQVMPELLAATERFGLVQGKLWGGLVRLAHASPAPRDLPALFGYIEQLDPVELRRFMLEESLSCFDASVPPEVLAGATAGESAAIRQLLDAVTDDRAETYPALERLIAARPADTQRDLLAILRTWDALAFRDYWPTFAPILTRDAESKRALAQTLSLDRLVEVATNGVHYQPDATIARVLIVPTYLGRPFVHQIVDQGLNGKTRIFCCPVAEESLEADGDAPPARLVKLYKALGDERRLRILKMLAAGDLSLPEITERLGVAKTTVHHHMVILRDAGLIRVAMDSFVYSLRRDLIPEASALLGAYLDEGMRHEA